jgi:hypothetical protein
MTRDFKKFLAICFAIAALIGAGWFVHVSARVLVDHVLACPAPCHWDRQKGYFGCSPLEAHLEIKTTPDPSARGEAIWYLATVKNNSCEVISLNPDFFFENLNYIGAIENDYGTHMLVTDAAGNPLPVDMGWSSSPEANNSQGEIHPYVLDTSSLKPLVETLGERGLTYESLKIQPGMTVVASPSILAPFRKTTRDRYEKSMVYTMVVSEPVGMKNPGKYYADPPKGFRRLSEYAISRSGTYRAQLVLRETVAPEIFEGGGSSLWKGLRHALYYFASPLSRGRIAKRVQINTTSEKIDFKVSR